MVPSAFEEIVPSAPGTIFVPVPLPLDELVPGLPGTPLLGLLGFKFWLLLGVEALGGKAWAGEDSDGEAGVICGAVTDGAPALGPLLPLPPPVGAATANMTPLTITNVTTPCFTNLIQQ